MLIESQDQKPPACPRLTGKAGQPARVGLVPRPEIFNARRAAINRKSQSGQRITKRKHARIDEIPRPARAHSKHVGVVIEQRDRVQVRESAFHQVPRGRTERRMTHDRTGAKRAADPDR